MKCLWAFVLNLGPNVKFLISSNLQKLAQIETHWLLQANLLNIHYLKIYKNWTQVDTLILAIHSFTCFSQQLFVPCINTVCQALHRLVSSIYISNIHMEIFEQDYTFLSNQIKYPNQDSHTFKIHRQPLLHYNMKVIKGLRILNLEIGIRGMATRKDDSEVFFWN